MRTLLLAASTLLVLLFVCSCSPNIPEEAKFQCPSGATPKHQSISNQLTRFCVDSLGRKNGPFVKWDSDTKTVRTKEYYVEGVKDGISYEWNVNGYLTFIAVYDASLDREKGDGQISATHVKNRDENAALLKGVRLMDSQLAHARKVASDPGATVEERSAAQADMKRFRRRAARLVTATNW